MHVSTAMRHLQLMACINQLVYVDTRFDKTLRTSQKIGSTSPSPRLSSRRSSGGGARRENFSSSPGRAKRRSSGGCQGAAPEGIRPVTVETMRPWSCVGSSHIEGVEYGTCFEALKEKRKP
jgi:hypothetical protein